MSSTTVPRLLLRGSDPSISYRTQLDLLGRSERDPRVRAARGRIGREGWAAQLLEREGPKGAWDTLRNRREDPWGDSLYHPKYCATHWNLIVLSDLGLTRKDARIAKAARLVLRRWGDPATGLLGGKGSEVCVTGHLVRYLTRFGYLEEPQVQRGIDWLLSTQKADGGWHCFPSRTGTIDGWEALAAFAAVPMERRSSEMQRSIERGAEFYLERRLLHESGGSRYGPWERLHYPNHYYYDLLVGLDLLTALGYGRDLRLRPALALLRRQRRRDGTWALSSVHPDLAPEDPYHPRTPIFPMLLEHPGVPSQWATLVALRVLSRTSGSPSGP